MYKLFKTYCFRSSCNVISYVTVETTLLIITCKLYITLHDNSFINQIIILKNPLTTLSNGFVKNACKLNWVISLWLRYMAQLNMDSTMTKSCKKCYTKYRVTFIYTCTSIFVNSDNYTRVSMIPIKILLSYFCPLQKFRLLRINICTCTWQHDMILNNLIFCSTKYENLLFWGICKDVCVNLTNILFSCNVA